MMLQRHLEIIIAHAPIFKGPKLIAIPEGAMLALARSFSVRPGHVTLLGHAGWCLGDNMGKKLYVGNLAYSVRDEELKNMFAPYGEVQSARVIIQADTGRSKGFGFVELASDDQAAKAIQELNGQEHGGRQLRVSEAKAPEERPARSGGGGGGYGGGRGGGPRRDGGGGGGPRNRW